MKANQLGKDQSTVKHINRAYLEMEAMKVGFTKVINGMVTTKWSEGKFEVGTFGKATVTIDEAADKLMMEAV